MNQRLLELAKRHGSLQARIAEQRRTLAQHAQPLAQALEKGDTLLKGVDWLKQHPGAVGLAAAVLAVVRPRGAWRWAQRGFFAWRGWQAIKANLGSK
ncbi:MAG: YqjK-like family protein [Rhodocyclales bacterium]|nr:YqjK-like family protein [Rhodocyclales bacterium]